MGNPAKQKAVALEYGPVQVRVTAIVLGLRVLKTDYLKANKTTLTLQTI